MNYPVVAERTLSALTQSWWPRRQRRTDLPELPPGCVYVLRVGGQYREYPRDIPFDPGHQDVLDASCVSLVDTRVQTVDVDRTVPSVSAADVFTLRTTFTCQVTDPAEVARQGVTDMRVPLRAYLAGDAELVKVGASHRVEEVNAVRALVTHRMTAYSTIVAPRVPGMSVEFVATEVLTPDDLRDWEQIARDERRARELEKARRASERDDVLSDAELLSQGPVVAEALALNRDGVDIGDLAHGARRRADEEAAHRRAREAERESRAYARETQAQDVHERMLLTLIQQASSSQQGWVDYAELMRVVSESRSGGAPSEAVRRALDSGAARGKDGGDDDGRDDAYISEDELL